MTQLIPSLDIPASDMQVVNCPLEHHFIKGCLVREMFVPEGTLFIGKIHKYEHILIIAQGSCLLRNQDGIFRVDAPYTRVCQPGTQRAAYAITDTTWLCVFRTDETDLSKIEDFAVATEQEYLTFLNDVKQLES